MLKILIAEDDQELSQLFSHVLMKNGYLVRRVSNGAEALAAMEDDYYDLLISDIMMPKMDGYELVRQLRCSGNQTPVMMITARDAFDDMRQGFLSGTDDYMVKPINVNEMVLRVGALPLAQDDSFLRCAFLHWISAYTTAHPVRASDACFCGVARGAWGLQGSGFPTVSSSWS